jgi:hypothetical protein
MCNRRELESLIVSGLEQIRRLEGALARKWATLATAPRDARVSFLRDLAEFQRQTTQLEKLLQALEEPAHHSAPVAA